MLNHEDSNDVVYAAVVLIYFAFRRTLTCATEFCLQDDEDNKLALLVFEAASAADGDVVVSRNPPLYADGLRTFKSRVQGSQNIIKEYNFLH